jgi:hypothetical protein
MRVLTFSALLRDGKLEMQPGFVIEGEPSHEEGTLKVEALGRGRRPLATTMLPLQTPCAPPSGDDVPLVAIGLVAFPERANGLRVSLDGTVLLEQTAPRGELEVNIEWPASLSGSVTVRWRASAETCIASLGYSNDGGETWTPLALPGPSETMEVNAEALPGGGQCLLELIVTDGFRTQRIRSGKYEVPSKGWVLQIFSPAADAKLQTGEPVLLAAQGYHLEERRAGFDDIQWESSASGGLGTGARVLAALKPGEHVITAKMHGVTAQVIVDVVEQSTDT